MAKHTAPAVKRRGLAHHRRRKIKRADKKPSKLTNLQKQGVLGRVNGFTVTRLEPEKSRVKRIFPESADSPLTEAKRVTFAWAEEAEQSSESRLYRANTRRTHSARDSSADSLNDFDASREPKRRRTIESSIVEDAEARKATSSMRLAKPLLQHSTPADALERGCSLSKRVFPRTPKPADRTETTANDTFDETSCPYDDGEGADEPKVSLASIFDEETNVENGEDQISGIEKCEEKTSLNSDETTVDLGVVDLTDVTPVRVRSKKSEEASKHEPSHENTENADGAAVPAPTAEVDLNVQVAEDATAPETEETSRPSAEVPQTDPALVSEAKADLTTSASPLDDASISRLTRRDSLVDSDNLEEDDVFKQRRSQIFLDEEEPMEISVIQAASRLSKAPTPNPEHEKEDNTVSSDPVLAASAERDETPAEDPARDDVKDPATSAASETVPQDTIETVPHDAIETVPHKSEQQPPTEIASTAEPDSGAAQVESSVREDVCNATFEEEEDLELQALSCRIKKISERDESMENSEREHQAENEAGPDKDRLSPDEADPVNKSTQGPEADAYTTLAIVPQGSSDAVPETTSPDESLTFSAAVPSSQTRAASEEQNSVMLETAPAQQSSFVPNLAQPNSDALVPSTPDVVSSSVAPSEPDAVSSAEGGALTNEDAGESRQAEVVSEVVQDHEANAQSCIEAGENTPAAKHDVYGDMECENVETNLANAEAHFIEQSAIKNPPPSLETENPETNEPESLDSNSQDAKPEEPEPEDSKTGESETEGAPTEKPETDGTRVDEPETDGTPAPEPETDEQKTEAQTGETTAAEAEAEDPTTEDPVPDQSKIDEPNTDGQKSPEIGEDVAELDQGGAGDTDIEKAARTSGTVSDPSPTVKTREKRTRRATKPFSPPTETKETPAPATSKKRSVRSKAATETPVAATPRTSRRINAKTPAKSAAEDGAETIASVEKTPAATRTEKTAATKPKTPKRPAAAPKASETEVDESESPTRSTEVPRAPKTPSRAGSRRAGTKATKTPATSSKATAAAKVAKSKEVSPKEASTSALSPSEGSKSAVKSSKASTAATSRRKTTK